MRGKDALRHAAIEAYTIHQSIHSPLELKDLKKSSGGSFKRIKREVQLDRRELEY